MRAATSSQVHGDLQHPRVAELRPQRDDPAGRLGRPRRGCAGVPVAARARADSPPPAPTRPASGPAPPAGGGRPAPRPAAERTTVPRCEPGPPALGPTERVDPGGHGVHGHQGPRGCRDRGPIGSDARRTAGAADRAGRVSKGRGPSDQDRAGGRASMAGRRARGGADIAVSFDRVGARVQQTGPEGKKSLWITRRPEPWAVLDHQVRLDAVLRGPVDVTTELHELTGVVIGDPIDREAGGR